MLSRETCDALALVSLTVVLILEMAGYSTALKVSTRVKPSLGERRRDVRSGINVCGLRKLVTVAEGGKLLGVQLLDQAEAAELALYAVEIAVMVGVTSDEAIAADAIIRLDPLDDMDGERQSRDPRFAVALVLQVELGGGCVLYAGVRSKVVDGLDKKMRLLPPIKSTNLICCRASPGSGDDQMRQAVPLASRSAGTMETRSST